MALGRILAAALLWHGVIAEPPDSTGRRGVLDPATKAPRTLRGRFLHISGESNDCSMLTRILIYVLTASPIWEPDFHPDEFYRVHSSTDEDEACHRGKGPAGTYGAETSDCDSPFALINATFDWVERNLKDKIDFIIWTGDSARHDSDEEIPRSQAQVLGTNRWISDKFAEVFAHPDGHGLEIPIVPTLGNNDILPHNILLPGPNPWLQHYAHIWRHFIPEEQRHSFEFGGWFFVEAIPNRLAIFSLNTLYFFDRNAGVDGCAIPSEPGYKQLEWLGIQLQFMRERGMKAILMGHVPPARTDSKMLWDETCWQKYTLWLQQFRDVVVAGLYGHMNIDHFLIQDTHDVDLALLADPTPGKMGTRIAMEDELSVASATDYLQELRSVWSKLAPPPPQSGNSGKSKGDDPSNRKGNGRKGKKDVWGERYQLSLVSPSIVPNYFPTLRVVEYNISGLDQTAVWADRGSKSIAFSGEGDQRHLELRSIDIENITTEAKKRKKKPNKDKQPKNPNLVIPDPPSLTSPPGPGYSVQPLSLTGYTQYFANLTYINNLTLKVNAQTEGDTYLSWIDWLLRWRRGKHGGKKPSAPKPRPREFYFDVEYSTFTDKVYKLHGLTVNSFVDLAYRMGQTSGKNAAGLDDDGEKDRDESDDEVEAESQKGKKDGKDKKKGKKKKNKTWLAFVKRAFVGAVEEEELKKLG